MGLPWKTDKHEPDIVGQALAPFNSSSNTIATDKLKSGQTVHIGLINALFNIGHNPELSGTTTSLPSYLQKFSSGISGKVASPWRVYLGAVILTTVAVIVAIMLYSGVRNSIISIGRNPTV